MGTITAQIQLTEAELKLLQTLVYQECGMYFDERRSHFLKDRLQRRVRACQLDSFYAYYRLLTSREGRSELALLLENLTVNETSFFRNRPQLELLQKSVLEEILHHKQERRDWNLRVTEGLLPELTFLLALPAEDASARLAASLGSGRDGDARTAPDRLEREPISFRQRVEQAYRTLALAAPSRFVSIDASLPAAPIAECICEHVDALLRGDAPA
jgi:hypothetical protein